MGAMDVCPFVPVRGATEADCVQCARELAKKLSDHLQVPIYLYGAAASSPQRKTVPQIRAGEYEGLQQKVNTIYFPSSHFLLGSRPIMTYEVTPVTIAPPTF